MSYRPDNWDEVKPKSLDTDPDWIDVFDSGVEAGADALYEAIWKMAKDSPTGTFTFDTNTINVFEAKE